MRDRRRDRQAEFQRELKQKGVKLGDGVYVARGSRIWASDVTIGDHSRINGPIRLGGFSSITIGRYCAIGSGVTMRSSDHDTRRANIQVALHESLGLGNLDVAGPVRVMNNVWIGDQVIILRGVTVGDGAVLGAGSIVTRDIPAFSVAVGSPARVIRSRFTSDVVEALVRIAWWDWDRARIERNLDFLSADLTTLTGADLAQLVRD
jgi:virginiamycin A acetyltransferase